jgi:hypothetical protein
MNSFTVYPIFTVHAACKILRTVYKDSLYYECSRREIGYGSNGLWETEDNRILVSSREDV